MSDTPPATLYGMSGSGNCYKPALLMRRLGIDFHWQEVDIVNGGSRTPEFLALNANGKVPLLRFADGRCLAESNAMLCYLADNTPLFPADRWTRAQILQWLFFEQYSHEPYIATVRFWVYLLGQREQYLDKIAAAMPRGYAALAVMEQQLGKSLWLVGEQYTIADIALYAYTHVAHEGDYRLDDYPLIQRWLARVEQQPGYFRMNSAAPVAG